MPHKIDTPLYFLDPNSGAVHATGEKEVNDVWKKLSVWVRQRLDNGDEAVAFDNGDPVIPPNDLDCWMLDLPQRGSHALVANQPAAATAHALVTSADGSERMLEWTEVIMLRPYPPPP